MNIEKIKQIVNSTLTDGQKENFIIEVLSKDENVIPTLLKILNVERENNKKLISDLNLEVSRYHTHINMSSLLKRNKEFLNLQTKTLYEKWKDFISPCFNNKF